MVKKFRRDFNRQFTNDKYANLLQQLNDAYPGLLRFRIAETPLFIDAALTQKLVKAGNDILETIQRNDFKNLTQNAIPEKWHVPNENQHPHFLVFDFAICKGDKNELVPKLIELQGFPSIFGLQVALEDFYKKAYQLPQNLGIYFHGLDKESFLKLFTETVLGQFKPEEVVLMDLNATEQKTMIDFKATQQLLGIPILSLNEIKAKNKQLYYSKNGKKIIIKRIYNRLIFDELETSSATSGDYIDFKTAYEVEWITHPNWFYRISKFLLPYLKSEAVPETYFLNELKDLPADLDNYVLKPLYSFAGQGVLIDVNIENIAGIKDPENWILQRKVVYDPFVPTPDGSAKCEIRLMYLWPDGDIKPTLATNLVRLSKGKMIGVRYNENFKWVGSTVAFMEKP
jgi:hypothetical protein